jgi:porin
MYSYKLGGEKGKAQITYAYSSANTAGFTNPRITPNAANDIISIKRGLPGRTDNWLVTFNLQQHLWTPEGSADYATGTQDFTNNPPGIGFFYRLGYMPEDRNMYNLTMSGGFGGRGVFNSRPNDRMGIGIYGMWASNDFKNSSLLLDALLKDELGVEAYYNFAITPWLQVSVDAQYIDQGLKTSNDAWVMGSRLNIRF